MPYMQLERRIDKLDARKGGYAHLFIEKGLGDEFTNSRPARIQCTIEGTITYSCALMHYGDGNYFIIVAGRYLKKLGAKIGDVVNFEIVEDPNPLGVEVPEVLTVLLDQDPDAKARYESLTDGKKRSMIHSFSRTKDIDKQVETIYKFLEQHGKAIHH